ncbi:hypothetical protein GCM10017767_00330 [Halomonas urumqiensis]|nr:hypothetical protein GCM10017767_00330 [Halomonas urumqiensis]
MPAVAAALVHQGKVLMVRRARPPNAGRLAFPGGKVEPGETVAEAVERELTEETGIRGRAGEVFEVLDMIERDERGRLLSHFVLVILELHWRSGRGVAASDAQEVLWLDHAALMAAGDEVCEGAKRIAISRLWAHTREE